MKSRIPPLLFSDKPMTHFCGPFFQDGHQFLSSDGKVYKMKGIPSPIVKGQASDTGSEKSNGEDVPDATDSPTQNGIGLSAPSCCAVRFIEPSDGSLVYELGVTEEWVRSADGISRLVTYLLMNEELPNLVGKFVEILGQQGDEFFKRPKGGILIGGKWFEYDKIG